MKNKIKSSTRSDLAIALSIILFICAVILCCAVFGCSNNQELALAMSGGDGSQNNPYIMTSIADWKTVVDRASSESNPTYVQLAANLSASSSTKAFAISGVTSSTTASIYNGALNVPKNKYIVLDLKNYYINRTLTETTTTIANGHVFTVYGNLTIEGDFALNGTTPVGGTIKGGHTGTNSTYGGGGLFIASGGIVTMNGGIITGNYSSISKDGIGGGGGVFVEGTFIFNDGFICNNKALNGTTDGGAIQIGGTDTAHGVMTMNGGKIFGNSSSNYGGGIDMAYSTLTVNGGEIYGNTASGTGGGISLYYSPTLTINDCYIHDNQASNGGGVGSASGGNVVLNGGLITNNKATSNGGGVYHGGGSMSISGGVKIYGNTKSDGTTANNLYIGSKTLIIEGSLLANGGAHIGIAPTRVATVTESYGKYNSDIDATKFFFSDLTTYEISNTIAGLGATNEMQIVSGTSQTTNKIIWKYQYEGSTWTTITDESYMEITNPAKKIYIAPFATAQSITPIATMSALSKTCSVDGEIVSTNFDACESATSNYKTATYGFMYTGTTAYLNPTFTIKVILVPISVDVSRTSLSLVYNGDFQNGLQFDSTYVNYEVISKPDKAEGDAVRQDGNYLQFLYAGNYKIKLSFKDEYDGEIRGGILGWAKTEWSEELDTEPLTIDVFVDMSTFGVPNDETTTYNATTPNLGQVMTLWKTKYPSFDPDTVFSVESVEYKSAVDSEYAPLVSGLSGVFNAGKYKFTLSIKDFNYVWEDGSNNTKTFEYTINAKSLNISWENNSDDIPIPSLDSDQICADSNGIKDTVAVNVMYKGINGTVYDSTTVIPQQVGQYQVEIVSLTNSNYVLAADAITSKAFLIPEKDIPVPELFPVTWQYNGSRRIFSLDFAGEYAEYFSVYVPKEFENIIFWDGDSLEVSATNAGKYELELRLSDPTNTQWRYDNGRVTKEDIRLKFEISALPLNLQIVSQPTIDCVFGEDATIYIEALQLPRAGESVLLDFYVSRSGSSAAPKLVYENLLLTSAGVDGDRTFYVPLKMSAVTAPANWELQVVAKSSDGSGEAINYILTVNEITFNVEEKEEVDTNIFWRLSIDGIYKSSIIGDLTDTAPLSFGKLEYNGKTHSFILLLPTGYEVVGYENQTATNAGDYTTTARVRTPEQVTVEYSINWTISPKLFNLSGIKWMYDGKVPYNGGEIARELIDDDTLPLGLEIKGYTDTYEGIAVGPIGTASVEFAVSEAYKGNYVCPLENNADTYEGSFEWNKFWEIVPAVISTSSWTSAQHPDGNKNFDIQILKDPIAGLDKGIVTYQYYETDTNGTIKDINSPLSVDELVWTEEAKYYVAKVALNDNRNYVLDNPNAQSKSFRLGDLGVTLIKIQVEPVSSSFEFTTQSRYITIKVTGAGLTSSAFNVEYFDGYDLLDSGPKDVGTYRAVISLKSNYLNMYEIEGQYEYDITIAPAKITPTWNTNAKPPVLNLAYGQINAIEYSIIDGDGNSVEYDDLQAGVTYRIKAEIKDEYRRNMQFEGSTPYDTQWFEFSVSDNKNLVDPSAPSNPAYPQENPELPSEEPTAPDEIVTPTKTDVTLSWDNTKNPPQLISSLVNILKPVYKFYGADGNEVVFEDLQRGVDYTVKVSFPLDVEEKYNISGVAQQEFTYKQEVVIEWNNEKFPPELIIPDDLKDVLEPSYEYFDKEGNQVKPEDMVEDEEYTVKVTFADGVKEEFNFVDKSGNSVDISQPLNPYEEEEQIPESKVAEFFKNYWQVLVSGLCLILTIIFLAKTAGYESKRKKFNKKAEKLESNVYAVSATGLFGLAMTVWTAIACAFIGLAVLSIVIMIIAKSRCSKAEENYEDSLEEYNRNQKDLDERKREEESRRREEEDRRREENMQMMFMRMMGGQGMNMVNGEAMEQHISHSGYMSGQQGLGIEDMRGLITETVTAILPRMQQMLPQQASGPNDELVQVLIEKTAKNEETMQNLIKKIAEQPTERVVEREVASTSVDDEAIKQMMRNQEMLMQKILELSEEKTQLQVVDKIVEKPIEVEKIVEKEVKVEVPIERIVEVPVEVEKIVEKEVRVEAPLKKTAKKVVKVSAPTKKANNKPQRLTLDEAYARLSRQQKKYFDGLRDYALTKYKCKEKKSTYFVVYGQTSTNPLLKLTIKKDTTVALLKMEDEYMKDIRRDATGDGTKVRVKETEVIVSDAQAYATAKKMVDLRDDQIERYQELLREQRSMKNKK